MSETMRKEQPTGEAWERLVEWAKESLEVHRSACSIAERKGESTNWEAFTKKVKERIYEGVLSLKAYEAAQSAEPNEKQKQRFIEACQYNLAKLETAVEVLTKERDEALRELANERSISDQVIDERNATIAELRSELDETRTERHAYKSRLREFCQRLVDMVGAEGPEDVQVMLDKVNAELHRLKQNIDSMSANLADKEGFLNSAGDEIERLTKERDEAMRELENERARSGRVTTAQINVIAELQAKLERPEMPECVMELVDAVCLEFPGFFAKKIAAVEAYYAPPFKVHGPGVYEDRGGNVWNVVWKDRSDKHFQWLGECDGDTGWFSDSGQGADETQLTKFLRPLEG